MSLSTLRKSVSPFHVVRKSMKIMCWECREVGSMVLLPGTTGSVDANNQLIIKGRFQQKQIENVLRRYIKEYVTCHTCRSPQTLLQKDDQTRVVFLQCETCGSRCSVTKVSSGYQAVTAKRAAMRAKEVWKCRCFIKIICRRVTCYLTHEEAWRSTFSFPFSPMFATFSWLVFWYGIMVDVRLWTVEFGRWLLALWFRFVGLLDWTEVTRCFVVWHFNTRRPVACFQQRWTKESVVWTVPFFLLTL